jgi:hypothetical protein
LTPDVDEGFRLSTARNLGIFEVSKHEIKFRAHEEFDAFLEVPRISPPMFLREGISLSNSFCFGGGEIEDVPEFFFKEKDLFHRSSLVDLNHLRNEQMFLSGPMIHMFQEPPFHLPDFFPMKHPPFSLERLPKLDQGVLKVMPDPLHDVKVIVLEKCFRPDFPDYFGKGGPEVKDDTVRLDIPFVESLQELFGYSTAIEPRDRFEIEDMDLDGIPSDLFISSRSSWHIFVEAKGTRELKFAQDLRKVIVGRHTLLPSIYGRLRSRGIKAPGESLGNAVQRAIILNNASNSF